MKKVLLAVAVLVTMFLTACEKDNSLQPEGTLLKADKGLMDCRGCGDWDIVAPEESSALRSAVADTLAAPSKAPKKEKGKGKGKGK